MRGRQVAVPLAHLSAGLSYSDPKGADASRMAWSFIKKQFTNSVK
jgi:hypothetical protein